MSPLAAKNASFIVGLITCIIIIIEILKLITIKFNWKWNDTKIDPVHFLVIKLLFWIIKEYKCV